jgi:hypothetical protein
MRAIALFMRFGGIVLFSGNAANAADLPLRPKPVAQRETPMSEIEQRIKLFEGFLRYLKERGPH